VQKSQRLRPEKWKASFDLEGRPVGFQKLLKIIRKGVSFPHFIFVKFLLKKFSIQGVGDPKERNEFLRTYSGEMLCLTCW
jgi:hypothetical protein